MQKNLYNNAKTPPGPFHVEGWRGRQAHAYASWDPIGAQVEA